MSRSSISNSSGPWNALARLAAFFLLTGLLAVAVHLAISWSLHRIVTGELGAFNRAMQGRVNAALVISGSSRAFCHYDPRILTPATGLSTFNLGRNASQIDVQLGVLKAYLKHNKKPRVVIQNLDLQSFVATKPGDVPDPSEYVPYLGDSEIYSFLLQINPGVWKWKYFPLYAYATQDVGFTWTLGLRTLCGYGSIEPCFDGFCPGDRPWNNDFERFKRIHPDGIDIPIDEKGVASLRELIELCQHEGIKVLLVYSPQYHEMVGLTRNRERIFALFDSIARHYKITFLDYTSSPICYSRALFYNAQHLNGRGAALFSEDLSRQLVAIGVSAEEASGTGPRPAGNTP